MLQDNHIIVQASIQARTAFFALAAAGLKTGETIVIIPASFRGPESVLALVESVTYDFADTDNLGTARGVIAILAEVKAGEVTRSLSNFPTFVGEIVPVGADVWRSYYSDVTEIFDSHRRMAITPAALDVGHLLGDEKVSVSLTAAGFNRHTVVLAQSGAGKSYGVGVLLEELVAKTRARIIVVDPNGDFVGLRGLSRGVSVIASHDPHVYSRGVRRACSRRSITTIFNFNALDQLLWSRIALELFETLWERRDDRVPTILAIDEAHNFGSPEPAATNDPSRLALIRLAAEGRKFGLMLLVATQRPQKLDANIISQCDNVVVMKLSSDNDIAHVAASVGAVSRSLIELARSFQAGTALAVGRIVKSPTLLRFRERRTPEGGGDISLEWCERRL